MQHSRERGAIDQPDDGSTAASPSVVKVENSKPQPLEVSMLLVSHFQLFWFVYSGSLGFVELQFIFGAEVLIINLLSLPLYRSRGVAKHVLDMVRLLFGLTVVLGLLVGGYAATLDAQREHVAVFADLHWHDFLIGIAYMAIRFFGIFLVAKFSSDPKLSWARSSLTSGAIAFLTMLCMAFIGFMGGIAMMNIATMFDTHVNASVVLAIVALAVHFSFSVLMSTMPQEELRKIADNPYAK